MNGNGHSQTSWRALDFEDLRAILMQRFPLIMVDSIESFEPGAKLTAVKNISGNDIHFLGHFPHQAVFPGVLIIEAMAQSLYVLDVLSEPDRMIRELTYLGNVSIRFLRAVVPGDQLHIEVSVVRRSVSGIIGNVVVSVCSQAVTKGELILCRKTVSAEKAAHDN
jgi:3-hydroxyacyl-[acyl-carrier-protein] dehydratase